MRMTLRRDQGGFRDRWCFDIRSGEARLARLKAGLAPDSWPGGLLADRLALARAPVLRQAAEPARRRLLDQLQHHHHRIRV
jgi:hypothetical protein